MEREQLTEHLIAHLRTLKAKDLPDDPDKLLDLYQEQIESLRWHRKKQQKIIQRVGTLRNPETGCEVPLIGMPDKDLTEPQRLAKSALEDFMSAESILVPNIDLVRMEASILEINLPLDEPFDLKVKTATQTNKAARTKLGRPRDPHAEDRRKMIFQYFNVDTKENLVRGLRQTNLRHKIYRLLDIEQIPFLNSKNYKSKRWTELQSNLEDEQAKDTLIRDMGKNWGRVGQTALGALMLEVYYRYKQGSKVGGRH